MDFLVILSFVILMSVQVTGIYPIFDEDDSDTIQRLNSYPYETRTDNPGPSVDKRTALKNRVKEAFSSGKNKVKNLITPIAENSKVSKFQSSSKKCAKTFYPSQDAERLQKALNRHWAKFYIPKKEICKVLARCTHEQRLQIATKYNHSFSEDLSDVIKNRTWFNKKYRKLLAALVTPLHDYYAIELHRVLHESCYSKIKNTFESSRYHVLTDIMCSVPTNEISMINQAYKSLYNIDLEDDLQNKISGAFKRLLVTLSTGNRDETNKVILENIQNDANALYEALAGKWNGLDRLMCLGKRRKLKDTIESIFARRNYDHLTQTFSKYLDIAGEDIEETIDRTFDDRLRRDDFKHALITIVKRARNKDQFFARLLYNSIKDKNHRDLIRLIVTLPKDDMKEVKLAFMHKYDVSLKNLITRETVGSYKECLLALIK